MLQIETQVTLMSHTFLAYFFPVKALFENSLTYWYVNACMHNIVYKERGDMTRTRSSGKSDLVYQIIRMIWKKVYRAHAAYRLHEEYV